MRPNVRPLGSGAPELSQDDVRAILDRSTGYQEGPEGRGSIMTEQVLDRLALDGNDFDVVVSRGVGLFLPSDCGLSVAVVATNRTRGFSCFYRVEPERRLILDCAELALSASGGAEPALFGVRGVREGGIVRYEGLRTPIAFSGGMLACRGPRRRGSTSNAFVLPWDYDVVMELEFRDGSMVGGWEHSDAVAALVTGRRVTAVDFGVWRGIRALMRTPELSSDLSSSRRRAAVE